MITMSLPTLQSHNLCEMCYSIVRTPLTLSTITVTSACFELESSYIYYLRNYRNYYSFIEPGDAALDGDWLPLVSEKLLLLLIMHL